MRPHQELLRLGRTQFWIVSRRQLISRGFTPSAIKHLRNTGVLVSVLPCVYRISTGPVTWEQRPMGVSLWAGDEAAISHLTAAHLQELLPRKTGPVHVTRRRSLRRRHGIVVHECALRSNDVVVVRGIRCTSVSRTLIDLCAIETRELCEVAIDTALRNAACT